MANKVVSIEDRIPKLKEQRRKRANRRLLILIVVLFFVILGIVYFQSPLSKVGDVFIQGNGYTDSAIILEKSGITNQTPILMLREDKVEKHILSLPQLKSASIKTIFPNKVEITVKEYERIAYIAENDVFYALLENGEKISAYELHSPFSGPILKGFEEPDLLQLAAKQLSKLPLEIKNAMSEVVYSPKKTDRYRIVVYMNDGFEVHANLKTFSEKMVYYPSLIKQLDPNQRGILDMEVGLFFRSYSSQEEKVEESGEDHER